MMYELVTLAVLFTLVVWTSWGLKLDVVTERRRFDLIEAYNTIDEEDRTETMFDRRAK